MHICKSEAKLLKIYPYLTFIFFCVLFLFSFVTANSLIIHFLLDGYSPCCVKYFLKEFIVLSYSQTIFFFTTKLWITFSKKKFPPLQLLWNKLLALLVDRLHESSIIIQNPKRLKINNFRSEGTLSDVSSIRGISRWLVCPLHLPFVGLLRSEERGQSFVKAMRNPT